MNVTLALANFYEIDLDEVYAKKLQGGNTMSSKESLALYASGPDKLEAALAGLSESDLDASLASGEWSIRQIVHHLADGEGVWAMCIKMAVGAPGSAIQLDWYPGNDEWADALDFAGRPVELAVDLFRAQRLYIGQLLERFPDRWDQHMVFGDPDSESAQQITVGTAVGLLTEHLDEHVAEIQSIREKIP